MGLGRTNVKKSLHVEQEPDLARSEGTVCEDEMLRAWFRGGNEVVVFQEIQA